MAWSNEFKLTCSAENCEQPIRSKGLCTVHYQRMYNYGRTERVKLSREGCCSVEGCDLPIKGINYCNKHYQLFKRHGKPEKLVKNARQNPLYIVWFEKKQNKRLCEEWMVFKNFCEGVGDRPIGNFILIRPDQSKPYGPNNFEWYQHLKKEESESNKEWWARKWSDATVRNPDKDYDRNLQRRYGSSLDEYTQKLIAQNYVCAMCGEPERMMVKGKLKRMAFDHNHKTMKNRELLCNRCNTLIGLANEDVKVLQYGIDYILKHNKENQ